MLKSVLLASAMLMAGSQTIASGQTNASTPQPPAADAARSTAAKPGQSLGVSIVTLGTAGGPRPRKDRSQSANLLTVDGVGYLVDVGENAVRQLALANVPMGNVRTVFITHAHSDHTMGLPAFLSTEWEFQRRSPLAIVGPMGTTRLMTGALAFLEANSEIRSTEGFPVPMTSYLKSSEPAPGVVYRDDKVTVTAVQNSHFNFPQESKASNQYQSYSYRFDTTEGAVVFTGDTGPSEAVLKLARGADTLVTEVSDANRLLSLYKKNGTWDAKTPAEQRDWLKHQTDEHLSPADVAKLARQAGVKTVILGHLTPVPDEAQSYAEMACEVARDFNGRIFLAQDLARFTLNGATPPATIQPIDRAKCQ